ADLVDQPLTSVRRHTEHSADELTCLKDLARMLEKVQRSGIASQTPAVLQWRRAKCAASLARAYPRADSGAGRSRRYPAACVIPGVTKHGATGPRPPLPECCCQRPR